LYFGIFLPHTTNYQGDILVVYNDVLVGICWVPLRFTQPTFTDTILRYIQMEIGGLSVKSDFQAMTMQELRKYSRFEVYEVQ
jgi:hypothetical protein